MSVISNHPGSKSYVSGWGKSPQLPLHRFFPQLPSGMMTGLLHDYVQAGEWVIDPFSTTPELAFELARSGYKVFVTSNNPIIRFILQNLSAANKEIEYQTALVELADSRRGDTNLESHLRSIYETACSSCNRIIQADAFLWRREEKKPYARIYRCPYCGDAGERPAGKYDEEKIITLKSDRLHRTRAFQRIDIGQDDETIEDILNLYSPRSLYFLFTLLNRVEGLIEDNQLNNLLLSLLISCFDDGNKLWTWHGGRETPRQLTIPTVYYEHNLWLSIEKAVKIWGLYDKAVEVTQYPDLPVKSAGICIFPGRLSEIEFINLPFSANFAAIFPRPNHAFWSLSAAWSGWLWGKEAVYPLKGVFNRKRYDWQWYIKAIYRVLSYLSKMPNQPLRFFAVMPDVSSSHLYASLASANIAGFQIEGLAYELESNILQGIWKTDSPKREIIKNLSIKHIIKDLVTDFLLERNEPATFLDLFIVCIVGLTKAGYFEKCKSNNSVDIERLRETNIAVMEYLEDQKYFQFYHLYLNGHQEKFIWLRNANNSENLTLKEQIEKFILGHLEKNPFIKYQELLNQLYAAFPGLNTPSQTLILECLKSYGEVVDQQKDTWVIRQINVAENRRIDVAQIEQQICNIGKHLGFLCKTKSDVDINNVFIKDRSAYQNWQNIIETSPQEQHAFVLWFEDSDSDMPLYWFFIMPSALISDVVFHKPYIVSKKTILVIPGSHSRWISYKLMHDARLSEMINRDWRIIKFRHIRHLAGFPDLTLSQLESMLDNDPIQWNDAAQMTIFKEADQ